MTTFQTIATKIIKEQALIIGPLAWDEARKVQGLQIVDSSKGEVNLSGDEKTVIDNLVHQYERLFGKASHAVCHDAVVSILANLSPSEIPSTLR